MGVGYYPFRGETRLVVDTAGLGAHWLLGERLAEFAPFPCRASSTVGSFESADNNGWPTGQFPRVWVTGSAQERATLVMYWVLNASHIGSSADTG